MVLLSALEDFVARTLSSIPTLLARLEYIAATRTGSRYEHWGLARVHGDDAACEAISQAHTDTWLQLIRTPIPALWHDLQETPEVNGVPPAGAASELVPVNTEGGSVRHFKSVLMALSALTAESKRRAA